MERIFYVSEKNSEYTQINFFKTEKEALKYGISEWPDFDMFGDPDDKEDSYDEDNDTWWEGESIDPRGDGLLISWEEDRVYIQSADDEEARKFVRSSKHWGRGSAIFFDSFKKGMYGILGNRTIEGKGYTWTFEKGKVNESYTKMKHLQTFENYSSIKEDAREVGEESDVIVDDILLDSGEKIKSAEIIGVIKTSKTEKEFKEYFYDEYGNNAFTEEDMQTLVKYYLEVETEETAKETEEEEEEKKKEGGEESGDDLSGDLADLEI